MQSSPATFFESQASVDPPAGIPWYCYAVLFGATSIVIGVLWDISWHSTIGRDTFWTPAHLAIYLGGVLGGQAGAWRCIWGASAMVTSAPFDNWWHNAYGLDVRILSPPHTVLALGMYAI